MPLLDAPQKPVRVADNILRAANKNVGEAAKTGRSVASEDNINPAELAVRVLVLAGAPMVLYIAVLTVVVAFYDDWPLWVVITYLITVVKSYLVARFFSNKRWKRWLGILQAVAASTGLLAGLIAYYKHLAYYSHYKASVVHVNVAANENVLRFADSGLLSFTADSHVDVSRSVGYQSAVKDATLCVAPIVDSVMAPTDPVSFFAVGTDCCEWRAAFKCDDAANPDAHGGALWLELSTITSPAGALAFEDRGLEAGFVRAVHLQEAVYSTVLANHTRFLRWAKDPTSIQDEYKSAAIAGLAVWSTFFILALFGAASMLAAGRANVRKLIHKGCDSAHPDFPEEIFRTRARPGRYGRTTDWIFQWL